MENLIEIKEINSKKVWEDFLNQVQPPTFLQSWAWGEFNLSLGEKIWRLGIFRAERLLGIALVIKVRARRGSFLLCPHGPLFADNNLSLLKPLSHHLKELARQERCSFIRISPALGKGTATEKVFKNSGFRPSPIHTHAELLWLLDIRPREEELLFQMRKQTRYSIKKAQKDGIKVASSADPRDLEIFWPIYSRTSATQRFTPFSKEYLRKEFEIFSKSGQALFFFAAYEKEIISTAMIIFNQWSGFYHHGASLKDKEHAQRTPSHLLQWEVIREAKKRGCAFYNFWGVVPREDKHHPWAGLSLFKRGFGGFDEAFLPSQDLVISPKYLLNYSVERLRKLKRRL